MLILSLYFIRLINIIQSDLDILVGSQGFYYNSMDRNKDQTPNEMEMSIFTFTHDYYLLELPLPERQPAFYKHFPLYQHLKDYKGQSISAAPIVRIYGTN